jgi:Ras-related protein Rab-2A
MVAPREFVFKVCILGDGSVGKTSLVLQYCERKFSESYIMTIGSNFAVKMVPFPQKNLVVRLQLWDLAGQTHFSFVRPTFYRGSSGALFVYDITKRETFNNLTQWIAEARQYIKKIPIAIVGNKVDLIDERVVSKREGEAFAEKMGALAFFETSAKTSENLDTLFNRFTEEILTIQSKGTIK